MPKNPMHPTMFRVTKSPELSFSEIHSLEIKKQAHFNCLGTQTMAHKSLQTNVAPGSRFAAGWPQRVWNGSGLRNGSWLVGYGLLVGSGFQVASKLWGDSGLDSGLALGSGLAFGPGLAPAGWI